MAAVLKEWKDKSITVVTCDGRIIVGILVGFDQVQNLVLNESQERVYASDETVDIVGLGLYVIRGDNVAIIGEATDWDDDLQCDPLPAIQQHIL